MSHQYAALEDSVYFGFVSNDTSGSAVDGTTPLFDVRLGGAAAGAAPVLSGTPDLLTHANYGPGAYEVAVAATAANGFAAGNTYLVFATLTADSQTPGACIGSFRLDPVPANVLAVSDDATAATKLEGAVSTNLQGTASGTPTTTTMVSDVAVTADDQFNGRTIIFDNDTGTAALRGQATDITACAAASNTLTFTALTTAPSSGDSFQIV